MITKLKLDDIQTRLRTLLLPNKKDKKSKQSAISN